jgi:hypothetical protein
MPDEPGIPNLDDCWNSDREKYAVVFAALADYCTIKSLASAHRAAGRIDIGTQCEKECERIYNELPKWARW